MAFRPFEFFRKRQKLILAALAIMAMFLFVIGDPLIGRGAGGRSKGWLGRARRLFTDDPERVATVRGSQLTIHDLYDLRNHRSAAHAFIRMVQEEGNLAMLKEAGFTEEELRGQASGNPIEVAKFNKKWDEIQEKNPAALRDLRAPRDSLATSVLHQIEGTQRDELRALIDEGNFAGMTQADFRNLHLSPIHLVDFVYWQRRADDLGIVMNAEQVIKDLERVGANKVRPEDLPAIAKKYKLNRDFDSLIKDIGEEIRVMMARGAVVGPDRSNLMARLQGSPSGNEPLSIQATPLDLWEAYVDVKRQLEVGILDVPVNQKEFLDQVPDPSNDELQAFFAKHAKQEHEPASEEPGFKIPKTYQIAFLYGDLRYGTDASKHYRQRAQAAQALAPLTFLGEVAQFYEQNKHLRYRTIEDPYLLQQAAGSYLGSLGGSSASLPQGSTAGLNVVRPAENALVEPGLRRPEVASLALGLASQAASGWPPFGVFSAMPRKDYVEKFLPLEQVHDGIAEELTEDQMRRLLDQDLAKLREDLTAYGKVYQQDYARWRNRPGARTDPAAYVPPLFTHVENGEEKKEPLDDYLRRFAKTRGLVLETMPQARPMAEIFKEEGKTPLGTLLKPMFFHRSMADDRSATDFALRSITEPKGLYNAQREVAPLVKPWEYALHWKTQETDPRVPTFEEARPKVLEAWKVRKAREIAEKYAQDLARQVAANKPDGYRILQDRDGYHPEKTLAKFELQPVGLASMSYRLASLPVIEHPTDDVVSRAFAELHEPGDTMVVANRPKDHYYVLVLKNRKEPRADDAVAVKRFDQEVILPDFGRGLQVNNQSLADYVLEQKKKQYFKEWNQHLRQVTRFNQENAERLQHSRNE